MGGVPGGVGGLADSPILASLASPPPQVGAAEGPGCSGDPATLTSAGGPGKSDAGASPGASSTLDLLLISACSVPATPPKPSPVLTPSLLTLSLLGCLHPSSPRRYKPLHSTPLPSPPLPTFFDLFVYFFPWQPPVPLSQTAQAPYNLKLICLTAALRQEGWEFI